MADLPCEDWWTPEQLALVEDRSRKWVEREFRPTDTRVRPGRNVAEGAELGEDDVEFGWWGHARCALCWALIAPEPEGDPVAFTDGRDWVCWDCFEKYFAPRVKAAEPSAAADRPRK
jgi:hypothetical protein